MLFQTSTIPVISDKHPSTLRHTKRRKLVGKNNRKIKTYNVQEYKKKLENDRKLQAKKVGVF